MEVLWGVFTFLDASLVECPVVGDAHSCRRPVTVHSSCLPCCPKPLSDSLKVSINVFGNVYVTNGIKCGCLCVQPVLVSWWITHGLCVAACRIDVILGQCRFYIL